MSTPILITSVGMVTCGGVDRESCWRSLGAPPVPPVPAQGFASPEFETVRTHQIRDWRAADFWKRRSISRYTRSAQFALKATEECLGGVSAEERETFGLVLGTQFSTIHNFHRVLEEPEFMTPIKFLAALPSSTPTNVSISLGLRGISTSVSSSVAGLEALSYGAEMLRDGYCSALVAGGCEEVSEDVVAGCVRGGVLAHNGHGDEGLTLGEAAGVMLVETGEHASAAGRRGLAEVAGWGAAHAPAGRDLEAEAGGQAMRQALAMAGLELDAVDALFEATNGWRKFDRRDARMRARLFGDREIQSVPLKHHTGEIFGAFGALAAAAGALSLERGRLPGLPELAGRPGGEPPQRPLNTLLIHDRGWDGSHAALVLKRVQPN